MRMFLVCLAVLLACGTAFFAPVQVVAGVYTAAFSAAAATAGNEPAAAETPPVSDRQADRPQDSQAAAAVQATQPTGAAAAGVSERKLTRAGGPNKPEIQISYPALGIPAVDSDIRRWALSIADAFSENLDTAEAFAAAEATEERPPYELQASYTVSRPSDAAVSITFEVWIYTGGAHGNLDIITLNYSLLTGQRLTLLDIFENTEEALKLMSRWSYQTLSRRFAGSLREQMLQSGTLPVPENFAALTLTPQGITINFQPYQVAPWSAGAQKVAVPLEELLPAAPLLRIWGR